MTTKRLGVFGGSFDPVHNGHVSVAALAREHLGLSSMLFVPAGVQPLKRNSVVASSAQRLTMLKLAVGDLHGARILRTELRRKGPSYTVDTVAELTEAYPGHEICLVIGSDNLADITAWHRYREILSRVRLCVAHRPGYAMRSPRELAGVRITCLPSPEWGVSSTMIRRMVREGHSCAGMVPEMVRGYIQRHGLYRSCSK